MESDGLPPFEPPADAGMPQGPVPGDPAAPAKPRKAPVIAATGLIAALVILAGLGGFLLVRGKQATALNNAIPANSTFVVTMAVNPSGDQSSKAGTLLGKFPATEGKSYATDLNDALDAMFEDQGASHADVRSWLGDEVVLIGNATTSKTPDVALIAQSTDDTKAQALVDKVRAHDSDHSTKWTTQTHDGVTVNSQPDGDTVYAVFDHLVVVGSTTAEVNAIIDTAHGHANAIGSNATYTAAMKDVPSENLGTVYVDMASFMRALAKDNPATQDLPASAMAELDALKSFSAAVTAKSNGFSLDGRVNFDSSKLSAEDRTNLAASPHLNSTLKDVPNGTFGYVAYEGLQHIIKSTLDMYGTKIPDDLVRKLGVSNILGALTGDFAVEANPAALGSKLPVDGALLLGTTDAEAMQKFLDNLMENVLAAQDGVTTGAPPTTQTYKGTTITTQTTTVDGLDLSWAVYKGMAIVGTTPAEVEAVMDTHDGSSNVTGSGAYSDAFPSDQRVNNDEMLIDVKAISKALRAQLPQQEKAIFELEVAPISDHFTEVSMSAQAAGGDHTTFRLFVGIS